MPATVSLSRLAWRNLWRNRRRTLLNLFGISFGVLFAVVVTGLSDATYGDMIDYAAKMGVGHVSVEHEEYREAPSFEHVPRIDAAKIDTLRQDPRVTRITRRISGGTLAASSSGMLRTSSPACSSHASVRPAFQRTPCPTSSPAS